MLLELIVKFMTFRSIKGKRSNIETLKFGVSGVLLLTLPVYLINKGTFITSLVIVNPNISFPLSIRLCHNYSSRKKRSFELEIEIFNIVNSNHKEVFKTEIQKC